MVLKPKQKDYSERRVRGMLGGEGHYRTDGCRSHILVFGGRDSKRKVLATAEILVPGASTWREVTRLMMMLI